MQRGLNALHSGPLKEHVPSRPQRLEGSRFVRWQFYRAAAGGSRELPSASHTRNVVAEPADLEAASRTG
jgi:hypothetical protein